jgi:zinc protease
MVAAVVAPIVAALAIVAWLRHDKGTARCCAGNSAPRLEAPMPADSALHSGALRNKVRYFVRSNGYPQHRAELRLVVNAGAVLESNDQRGLAHAVEHMVFRGTKNFPGHAIEEYLQSIGMRSGSDINASTSQDETIFQITIPTDRPGVLDTALAILGDMAHNATFDPAEARQEAGVVMAEWRSQSDAAQRLRDERNALLLAGSMYAHHPVIGDTAVLRRFDVGAMRRFYRDWYRPDLMAVVVTGDVDPTQVQRLIKTHFADLPQTLDPRPRLRVPVSPASDAKAAILSDAEATSSRIVFWRPNVPVPWRHFADYRASLIDELWRALLRERLDDAVERPGSPILDTDVGTASLVRGLDADVINVEIVASHEQAAVELFVGEVGRLARFGVTPTELARSSAELLRERRRSEQYSDNSGDLADALADEFLTGNAHVDRESSYELARILLPTIRPADILARARRAAVDSGAVLILSHPTTGATVASPGLLIAGARSAFDRATAPIVDSSANVPLMPMLPTPGTISAERHIDDARVFDWTLSNGMRVILKPTLFAYNQIEFRMFGAGGASLATDAEYPSAFMADGVIKSTGFGTLNGKLLARRLDTTSVEFSPSVRDEGVSLSGSAAPKDLELFFQLLHLHFTAARADTVAFRRFKERIATWARGRMADPDAMFSDSVAAIVGQHHTRSLRSDAKFASAVRLPTALEFWNARMANASNFTLVIAGDFSLDRIRPLIARYLASLPAGAREQARDVGFRPPTGVVRRTMVAGIAPNARTEITLSGAFDGTNESTDELGAATDVAELALQNVLREQLGGTYDATVESSVDLVPPARYTVTIDFDASPDRMDSLVVAAFAELDRLRTRGPTDSELEKVRAARTRDLDGKMESNRYWASELMWHARMGWPLATITKHQDAAKRLTKAALRTACSTYLRSSEYVQVTRYPKPGRVR